MSTGTRVARFVAEDAAARIAKALRPAVSRLEVAGSIRRAKPDVGDIEFVAVPVIEREPDGMFATVDRNRLTERIDALLVSGDLASHPTDPKRGERYSKLMDPMSGLQLDLFSATSESFGLILLIRTGPDSYSRQFVTDLRRRILHVGKGQLHRGSMGCGEFVCEVVPTPEEGDVYAAANWPYIRPELRA